LWLRLRQVELTVTLPKLVKAATTERNVELRQPELATHLTPPEMLPSDGAKLGGVPRAA
jgi:hypothetical protein